MSARLEARDRSREVGQEADLPAEARILEVAVQRERLVVGSDRLLAIRRRLEGDASQQHGAQRFHAELHAVGSHLYRHAGGIPE